MKICIVESWDKFYILPAIGIVTSTKFTGYRYIDISWFKTSIEISWDHLD